MQMEDDFSFDNSDIQKEDTFEANMADVQREDKYETSTPEMQMEEDFTLDTSDIMRGKKGKKPTPTRNCHDLKKQGKKSGAHMITPCDDDTTKVVKVYCDMDTDGGGWTVIQRRDNYLKQQNFYYSWATYVSGFGSVMKDFWLGNDNIHCLTEQHHNEIRFDLGDWSGNSSYAKYDFFHVDDRINRYKLTVRNYTGNAGDSFTYHNNMMFSTYDEDNDVSTRNCASSTHGYGAWWYKTCVTANLNAPYNGTSWKTPYWYKLKNSYYSLKKTEMKLRPKH
ncbi:unnamed protein product [Meganyctiphanes norvegica]|uniref:Fibrinogen C-terminal domain-containing protein n=1 Tax=Meganyctiphanes norvegica TaxID=48144 RepID=A0AAV2QJ73_MEGNR